MLLLAAPAHAAPVLVPVGTFSQPTYATSPPGDARVFVTERTGKVQIVGGGTFLDLTADVESGYQEEGLLSIAFAPDYATSGKFYVYLTRKPDKAIEIREYTRATADTANPGSERVLATIAHPDNLNHDGGQLQFGPDGKLYAGTGDGGGSDNQYGNAQNPNTFLGKLLTIDLAGGGPSIVAMGLRNPWRFSFAPDGRIVIGDVGQNAYEEVDVGLASNYGWPCYEGLHAYKTTAMGCSGGPFTPPVLELPHTAGFCALVGGYVVRDAGLPTLDGRYVYGDNCNRNVYSVDLANPGDDVATGLTVDSMSSFGEDGCGRLLTVSLAGPVSRVQDGDATQCPAPVVTPTPTPTETASPTPAPTAEPAPVAVPAPRATPVPVAVDTRPCTLSARVTGLHSLAHRRYLSVALRAPEACRATLSATHFRTTAVSLAAGKRVVVKLRLSTKRRVRAVTVRISAVDAAGNRSSLSKKL